MPPLPAADIGAPPTPPSPDAVPPLPPAGKVLDPLPPPAAAGGPPWPMLFEGSPPLPAPPFPPSIVLGRGSLSGSCMLEFSSKLRSLVHNDCLRSHQSPSAQSASLVQPKTPDGICARHPAPSSSPQIQNRTVPEPRCVGRRRFSTRRRASTAVCDLPLDGRCQVQCTTSAHEHLRARSNKLPLHRRCDARFSPAARSRARSASSSRAKTRPSRTDRYPS